MAAEALAIRDPNYVERVKDAFAGQGFLRKSSPPADA
jgi:hypothetical protein